jgi:hypothetical protein
MNFEPVNWNYRFGTKEWTAASLSCQGNHIFTGIPLWPGTRSSVTLFRLLMVHVTSGHCQTSFVVTVVVLWDERQAGYLSIYRCAVLCIFLLYAPLDGAKSQRFLHGTLWQAHQGQRVTFFLLHTAYPSFRPPCHPGHVWTGPLDRRVIHRPSLQPIFTWRDLQCKMSPQNNHWHYFVHHILKQGSDSIS